MKEKFKLKVAVILILTKIENNEEYILLQKRQNTGILDGFYDCSCCGHLEEGETLKEGIIRESKEELGIDIAASDLEICSTMHASFKNGGEYLLITFHTNKYKGTPKIMEPNKCSDLKWFKINDLPIDLADTRRISIENYKNKNYYSEYGFNKEL